MHHEKLPISVLVQTKNEEASIALCLESLSDFDEVIVIDSNSSDATKQICSNMGVAVVNFFWNGRYPKKKQWQLTHVDTRHNWVLFLDADESPTEEFIQALRSQVVDSQARDVAAYDVELDYVFAGRQLRYGHRVVKRALVHRHRVNFPVMDDLEAPGMGELEGHYQPEVSGRVVRLNGRILHDDRDPVRTWFDRHNKYSDWEAFLRTRPQVKEAARQRRSLQGQIFDAMPLKPLVFFLYSYVVRGGFLDGRAGLDYALALSNYYWQISLKVRELNRG